MSPFADFERADALLRQILDLPESDRTEFLEHQCRGDDDLRALVEELLAAAVESGSLAPGGALDSPVWSAVATDGSTSSVGQRVGAYRILDEIGRGGMAVVYLAERADGAFEGRAALKLLRPSRTTEDIERRFVRERQILAHLRHPHIAQLLDGGTIPSGQAYLAMEHVAGEPVDRYCDRRGLGVDDRLRLFLRVCSVVQFAHQNLVVHRDLKPSNILVTAAGDPKLLDFGIAKLLEPDAAGELTETAAADRVLTPRYASPEQILGETVSVATDVYALGLLLFELLTGRPARRLASSSAAEVESAARSDAPLPSAVVRDVPGSGPDGGSSDEIAAARGLTADKLHRRLRGDLDTIVRTALRREPGRRYASVERMADDVQRHLDARPVLARPDSLAYRAGKFARRHTAAVVAAVFVVVLSSGFVAYHTDRITRERNRAKREAATARAVTDFLLEIFTRANPYDTDPGAATALELVDLGAESLEGKLDDDAEVHAAMEEVLAQVYDGFGRYDRAEELLRSALATRREVYGDRSLEVASTLYHLARVAWAKGDADKAEILNDEVVTLRSELLEPGDMDLLQALSNHGTILQDQGRLEEAEAIFGDVVSRAQAAHPAGHREIGGFLNNLANVRYALGEYESAEATMRRALENDRRILPDDDPAIALRLDNLATMARRAGRAEEAAKLAEEALDLYWHTFGQPHPHMPWAMTTIAEAARTLGDPAKAERMLTEALEMRLELLGPDHVHVSTSREKLGLHFLRQGRNQAAREQLEEALRIARLTRGDDSASSGRALWNLGLVEDAEGHRNRAEELMARGVALLAGALGEDHPEVAERRQRLTARPE